LSKIKANQGQLQGMSYWTYSDLFEESGPPPTPFHGGFGLLNREGIRKPAFFAYKYLNALAGQSIATDDAQALLATDAGNVTAVIWDFEQPEQKLSDRPFYTKVIPSHPAAPVKLTFKHLAPNAAYNVDVYRTGFHANDAYSTYLEMGRPNELSATQIAQLSGLTRDLPEKHQFFSASKDGTLAITLPMNSNDVVLVKLVRTRQVSAP
jgi:xylan 1,4-beta-xylosidase